MTTKDQAFPDTPLTPYHRKDGAALFDTFHLHHYALRYAEQVCKPTPDCRTCVCYYTDAVGPACLKNGCTNGDKYQPEPKVVLWRTE